MVLPAYPSRDHQLSLGRETNAVCLGRSVHNGKYDIKQNVRQIVKVWILMVMSYFCGAATVKTEGVIWTYAAGA
jgi:hypothetical protein